MKIDFTSAYFSPRALKALNRLGDILVPGDDELPSFSEYGGLQHIDKMVSYAPIDDINDLNMAMLITLGRKLIGVIMKHTLQSKSSKAYLHFW